MSLKDFCIVGMIQYYKKKTNTDTEHVTADGGGTPRAKKASKLHFHHIDVLNDDLRLASAY